MINIKTPRAAIYQSFKGQPGIAETGARLSDRILLRKRAIVESVIDQLKNISSDLTVSLSDKNTAEFGR